MTHPFPHPYPPSFLTYRRQAESKIAMLTVAQASATLDAPSMQTTIASAGHRLIADEPVSLGGSNAGPTPTQLVLGALASCTAITIAMYVRHKGWPMTRVSVHADGLRADEKPGPFEKITLRIALEGELTGDQRARIMGVSSKCPVHRMLAPGVEIETTETTQA